MTDKNRERLLDATLAELYLNQSMVLRLKYEGIITLRDLLRTTKRELLGIRNIGKKGVEALEGMVMNMGFRLGMEEPDSGLSDERKQRLWECFRDIALKGFRKSGDVVPPAWMCAFITVRAFEEYIVRVERALAENPDLFDYNLYDVHQIKGMLFPEMGEDDEDDQDQDENQDQQP